MEWKQRTLTAAFTLIELLVVIALLGIFAAIVIASLTSARGGGKDAAVQSQVVSLRNAAEIYFSDNGGSYGSPTKIKELYDGTLLHNRLDGTLGVYGNLSSSPVTDLCSDPKIQSLLRETAQINKRAVSCSVGVGGQSYRIYAILSNPKQAFCIDSAGFVGIFDELFFSEIEFPTTSAVA